MLNYRGRGLFNNGYCGRQSNGNPAYLEINPLLVVYATVTVLTLENIINKISSTANTSVIFIIRGDFSELRKTLLILNVIITFFS